MSKAVRCMWIRGGTSKGGYFLNSDLPEDVEVRNAFLLRAMGSPDPGQIDGMGGGDPLTSKVAVVRRSDRPDVDVDYLFLQVSVDEPLVSDAQNCGNLLAGVGPFAIERGLVKAQNPSTEVAIYMENTGQTAIARVETPDGQINETGTARIDGVPGAGAPIQLIFQDTAGSTCGSLLPSGQATDRVNGIDVTLIDNGMPCVILRAGDMGIRGAETPQELDANNELRQKLERLRLACGPLMNLGDVRGKTVPKMTIVSNPLNGGAISTRSFIPHHCHKSIGVLAAVSVATACLLRGSTAYGISQCGNGKERYLSVEHPSGEMTVVATLDANAQIETTAILRTARKLMDGEIFA